jgi:nitroreductase
MTASSARTPDHAIEPLFVDRWSPRSFTGEPIPEETLFSFFEAARWAPSSYNSQPWRFVWALAGTPEWEPLFGLISPHNQIWAKKASALVAILSKSSFRPPQGHTTEESPSHAFDTGAAWASFALQATAAGWYAHAIGGFDKPAARRVLGLPVDVHPQVMAAVGRLGDPAVLPEALRTREAPNGRHPVSEFAFRGRYPR